MSHFHSEWDSMLDGADKNLDVLTTCLLTKEGQADVFVAISKSANAYVVKKNSSRIGAQLASNRLALTQEQC